MISLSIDAINARAPYVVEQAESTTFFFTTKQGVLYSVGFVRDYSFLQDGLYQFFITNVNHIHANAEDGVFETVKVIVEEFFAQGQPVMLYICDTMDDRQAVRDRLFQMWFHMYISNTTFTMYNEQVCIDNIQYFASIILRKDHPQHNLIINTFHDFVQDIPNKLDSLQ